MEVAYGGFSQFDHFDMHASIGIPSWSFGGWLTWTHCGELREANRWTLTYWQIPPRNMLEHHWINKILFVQSYLSICSIPTYFGHSYSSKDAILLPLSSRRLPQFHNQDAATRDSEFAGSRCLQTATTCSLGDLGSIAAAPPNGHTMTECRWERCAN